LSNIKTLANSQTAWRLGWEAGKLRSAGLENRLSGRSFDFSASEELALVLSAAPDRLAEPLVKVSDFVLQEVHDAGPQSGVFTLRSASTGIEATLRYELDGAVRRKHAVLKNGSDREILVLDILLDDLSIDAALEGGGQGQPVFAAGELFAAVEHPSGWNEVQAGHIRLSHCPGRRLAPGAVLDSHTALVSAAPPGGALNAFVRWIQERCHRLKKGMVSVYTPFGINNQWGLCSTLDDEQCLHVLGELERWQKKGIRFDYFTLDTGWVDYGHDLTRFRPVAFPEGPEAVIGRVEALGMRFGLWFATSWGSQSCWDYLPAWGGREPPPLTYRNGHAAMADYPATFCLAAEPYFALLKQAVLHHIRNSGVRFLKFDGGNYACNDLSHGHLPGKYAVERMHDLLIELAAAARAEAPDVFVMWYWGLRSPFWALHGDTIFESGLFMEGSGTSAVPAIYYRDSVTLAQDQNACNVQTIPAIAKDSLGVWLADTRWGNYMARERWREALVMDLGRGNLLFPNLWGDIYLLDDDDVAFLTRMDALARRNEQLLLQPRTLIGDPMKNDVYGYAYCKGDRGVIFLNNAHFSARKVEVALGPEIGLTARPGAPLRVGSHFPERQQLLREEGTGLRSGDTLTVTLRPFESLLLEVTSSTRTLRLPVRSITAEEAGQYGMRMPLREVSLSPDLDVRFADATRFEQAGHVQTVLSYESALPILRGDTPAILAVAIRLRRGGEDWKYAPVVAEIVQALARVQGERVHFVPVPDARQFGNTQKAGCSWVVYKTRLPRRWTGAQIRLAVHAFLPTDVEAQIEAWVVRRWWEETARPVGDGYYADAPS
jgi:hypothetical protein